ncbi:HWE histidine kinase domain-containing protein [Novosphingobium colocasiae]
MDAVRKEIARVKERLGQRRLQAINTAQLYEKRMAPLLALIGVAIAVLVLIAVLFERRHAVAATKAQQAEVLRVANERTELVARELNHRVKNLFAVVLSIVSLTGRSRNADRETMNELRARIHALSIAHAASQGQVGGGAGRSVGRDPAHPRPPYADTASGRVALDGPGGDAAGADGHPAGVDLPRTGDERGKVRRVLGFGRQGAHHMEPDPARRGGRSCRAFLDRDRVVRRWIRITLPRPAPGSDRRCWIWLPAS